MTARTSTIRLGPATMCATITAAANHGKALQAIEVSAICANGLAFQVAHPIARLGRVQHP